jgi:hypothetical protein
MGMRPSALLLGEGCAKSRGLGAGCQLPSDCDDGSSCTLRFAAGPKEPRFCTRSCRQHEADGCGARWHCEPDPFSARLGQCEPSFWPPR